MAFLLTWAATLSPGTMTQLPRWSTGHDPAALQGLANHVTALHGLVALGLWKIVKRLQGQVSSSGQSHRKGPSSGEQGTTAALATKASSHHEEGQVLGSGLVTSPVVAFSSS